MRAKGGRKVDARKTMTTKSKSKDYIPVTVPFSAASRTGELEGKSTREISSWANRNVWTDRMLNALTVGVRGGKSNTYFTERGYRSLRMAHSGYVQSLQGNH